MAMLTGIGETQLRSVHLFISSVILEESPERTQ